VATRQALSIYDVAREIGVSSGTVSRALNDRAGVSAKTRRLVLEAVERLSYVASPLARGLARRSTAAIGIIIPGLSDPFFGPITDGIQSEARRLEHAVMLSNVGRATEDMVRAVDELLQYRVAGIAICGGSDRLDRRLSDALRGVPTVLALRRARGGAFPSVYVNHARGARQIVRHLLTTGRRRVAFVRLNDDSVAARDRLRGYREELRAWGVTVDPQLIVTGGFGTDEGRIATKAILEWGRKRLPDAIFYASDAMAIAGLRTVRDNGIKVPDDVAIAGFGDIAFAELSVPSLTTVRVPKSEIGRRAGQLLEEMMGQPGLRPADVELDVELVERESTTKSSDEMRPPEDTST
jgi:DNA-binding LacI/PurR family transcriptional regulator